MDMQTLKGLYETSQTLNNNVDELQMKVQALPHYANGLMSDKVEAQNKGLLEQLDYSFKQLQWFNSMLNKSQKQALNAYKRSIKYPKQFSFDKKKFKINE